MASDDSIDIHITTRPGQSSFPRGFAGGKIPEDCFEKLCSTDEGDPFHPVPTSGFNLVEKQFFEKAAEAERERLRRAGLAPLDKTVHAIYALQYAIMNREKELVGLIPEGYEAPEMEFYVDGERVEFDKEAKDLKQLEISKELDSKIRQALAGWEDLDALSKLSILAGRALQMDLEAEGLTAQDVYSLAVGDYTVKPRFEVGQYYRSGRMVYKVKEVRTDSVTHKSFDLKSTSFCRVGAFGLGSSTDLRARVATEAEIVLFKRAENFNMQGRKLNEFKDGDIIGRQHRPVTVYRPVRYGSDVSDLILICPVEKRGDKLAD